MGIALAADGKLLVADSGNGRLRAIDTDGRVGTWSASLSLPVAVAVLPSGDAVVSDAATGLLRKVAATGAHAVTDFAGEIGRMGWNDGPLATASISETFALVARADGELILLDGASARVRAIRDGMVDTLAGGQQLGTRDGIGSAAAFACPRAAAVTPDGSLLVVDAREHALRRITFGP